MIQTKIAPYGTWDSPITSEMVAAGASRTGQLAFAGGTLYWLETRVHEGGRYVLVRCTDDGRVEDVTPAGTNVRTAVHEYGGTSYLVGPDGDTVWFSEWAAQRLYRQDKGDHPTPISPEPEVEGGLRFAEMRLTPDGRHIVATHERHAADGTIVNEIVALPAEGGTPSVIATGADFYAYPRVSPDGRQVAWTQWDFPNMPWDGTELWLADLDATGRASNARRVAGGLTESVYQPEWSPEGVLHFVSDSSGWWNLYRYVDGESTALAPVEAEIGAPIWRLGTASYAFLSSGERIACIVTRNGVDELGVIEPGSGRIRTVQTPFNDISDIASDGGERLALLAGSATLPAAVVLVNVTSGKAEPAKLAEDAGIDPACISAAQPIEFPTSNGQTAHAFYYTPRNPAFSAPEGDLPPLLVNVHGGPTSQAQPTLSKGVQFWTSRGFAYVDINYGGSTGYGRAYRERLKGNWGIVDVEDSVAAARYLAEQGLADERRVAVRGGSAGGYTTLAALTTTDFFAAGADYYGLSDLVDFNATTHKFESRYLDLLVGPLPEALELMVDRSPATHAERLTAPLIIFQGLEDKIVPPSQSEIIVAALEGNGVTCEYITFEGEQHGFLRADTVKRTLDEELAFYGRVFGVVVAADPSPDPSP